MNVDDFSLISLCDATKAGKLYSIVPDDGSGDFDVARNSTATYLGADGLIKTAAIDEPRIEFNPDGSYKGLLIEPQRTNLFLRSEEFDDAVWAKTDTTITANDAVAPDGQLTADKVIPNVGTGPRLIQQTASFVNGNSYSYSIFAKADGMPRLTLLFRTAAFGSNIYATFDLPTTAVIITDGVTATIEDVGNGYRRCIIVATATATTTVDVDIYVGEASFIGFGEVTGDGVSGAYLWGAQLEAASTASSYIPTVASTVTRVADSVTKTGISSLIGQTEGTLYAEYFFDTTQADIGGIDNAIFWLSDNTSNNLITLSHYGEGTAPFTRRVSYFIRTNNVDQALIRSSQLTSGVFKVAATYKENSFKLFVNGAMVGSELTGTIPATSQINLNNFLNSNGNLIKEYKSLAILPTAITEAEAIALTSL